jgi:hypothetical protein
VRGLEAVRAHHLAEAEAQAETIIKEARAQAARLLAQSSEDAEELLARARQEGREAAALDTDREVATARRRARGVILAAERDAYESLRIEASKAIRADARYPALLERIGDSASRQLGPGTDVVTDPQGDGGVSATRKNRRAGRSLKDIVDESLRRLGPAVTELWR